MAATGAVADCQLAASAVVAANGKKGVGGCRNLCSTNPMATTGSQHFPPHSQGAYNGLTNGYRRVNVSIFNRWMTREEVTGCPMLSRHAAKAAGLEAVYSEQERRFLAFYRDLFASGALRKTRVGRGAEQIAEHAGWDRRIKRAVRSSLRDRKHFDVYVPAAKVRALGNWDRTDVLLFEDGADTERVTSLAAKHGLTLLDDQKII